MKIGIVLNGCEKSFSGGVKVIFQYANYLAENQANIVTLYFNMNLGRLKKMGRVKFLQHYIGNKLVQIRPNWFELNPKIKKKAIFSIDDNTIADGDIIVATAIYTARAVAALKKQKGKKFYFIQGYENWSYTDEFVMNSYKLGMTNITVSGWLSKIVEKESGEKAICIRNGIDTKIFKVMISIKDRPRHSIAMHYRSIACKGCEYALETIRILENRYPDLEVTIVSIEPEPLNLPKCCKYVMNAKQEEVAMINNNAVVFMCSSINEGFGLPGLEAMACGCVLAASEYQGVFEYAEDRVSAMLSPLRDSRAMADNIIKIFEDDDLREKLSENAIKIASTSSIEIAAKKFAQVLLC